MVGPKTEQAIRYRISTARVRHDTEDNLVSITDASGHTTSFPSNPQGWVMQTASPRRCARLPINDQILFLMDDEL